MGCGEQSGERPNGGRGPGRQTDDLGVQCTNQSHDAWGIEDRACVRMVKIIMGNHACRLSVPRAAGPAWNSKTRKRGIEQSYEYMFMYELCR